MRFLTCLVVVVMGCGGGDVEVDDTEYAPLPGSTLRVAQSSSGIDEQELNLEIFSNQRECATYMHVIQEENRDLCPPHVDRMSGEVRLGFHFLFKEGGQAPLAVTDELLDINALQVYHNSRQVMAGQQGYDTELIPHNPEPTRQLYILMIDGSGSMKNNAISGRPRMEEVRNALLMKSVRESFFPEGQVKTAVAIFTFTQGEPKPLGGELKLLRSEAAYVSHIRDHLRLPRSNEFTHLYDAVQYSVTTLIQGEGPINTFLAENNAFPTVVVLTDGFNNVSNTQACSDNADRLKRLLRTLDEARHSAGVTSNFRPTVYTVGLGKPIRGNFSLPERLNYEENTSRTLCGRNASAQISGHLEERGIDNVSLEWIAVTGGGRANIQRNKRGLGQAFQETAAQRYNWFELRYRVPPALLRRGFETIIRLTSPVSEGSIRFSPSAWLDAPPAAITENGWTEPKPYRVTLMMILPFLGVVMLLSYLSAALYNARRVLFGRTRPPRSRP